MVVIAGELDALCALSEMSHLCPVPGASSNGCKAECADIAEMLGCHIAAMVGMKPPLDELLLHFPENL